MKMYYFNPNDYGEEYFVMAENKTEAIKSLLEYLKGKVKNSSGYGHENNLDIWQKAIKSSHFPKDYTLEEYDVGEVVESELS